RAHSDEEAVQTILNGLPQAGMPSFQKALSADDARAIVAFIHRQETLWEPKQTVHSGDLIQTQRGTFKLELFATGFENPWSFAFLPDGKVILTEKAGRLRILDHGKLTPRIKDIPRVHYQQDGGLLSLALDPDYAQSGWIYLSFSDRGEKWGTSMTKIIRGKIRDGHWVEQQTIWAADQKFYYSGDDHYGCRLLFVQGKLFFTIGDRGNRNTPQDLSNPCGKIHRVNPNGTVPSDNPFVGRKDADPTVWSYGHRNPQGLAVDQQTGELWEVEHGPKGGDELNHIRKGGNYGWPLVTYGRNEDGTKISDVTNGAPGMLDPIAQWTPSLAPGVLYYSNSDRYPGWKNQFLVGFLHGQQLHRVEVKGDTLIDEEAFLNTIGRVRDIETGPDGLIYIAVEHWDQPGSIWRLVPVEK
ncbi:MAG TPA: PQQ-dependent sugar dehydrogenase, partial [Opitutaceae bacterium]